MYIFHVGEGVKVKVVFHATPKDPKVKIISKKGKSANRTLYQIDSLRKKEMIFFLLKSCVPV